jgi:acyl carrier protein
MNNKEKLKKLLIDIFLLQEDEFNFDLKREDVDTWDSLGIVSMAVGIKETFGYHLTPDQATSIKGVKEIIDILESNGIKFDE